MKDKNSIFRQNGCSNHSDKKRQEDDYYATEPKAAELLLEVEPDLSDIWECACGEGHLAKVFDKYGKLAKASDLINRGYGVQQDFLNDLTINFNPDFVWNGDIVTNPPYSEALEFCQKALNLVKEGSKVCMFLKLTFLESKERKLFFETTPPRTVYVFSGRVICAMNGDFHKYPSSAIAYAWFVWEKGYKGKTVIKWIN